MDATGVTGTGLAGDFDYKGGTYPGIGGTCGVVINADCTIVVRYTPSGPGSTNSQIDINYNNGLAPTTVTRLVDGEGAAAAGLTISETGTFDYDLILQGFTHQHVFTVENTGGVEATLMSGIGLLAPFEFAGGLNQYPGCLLYTSPSPRDS